MATTDPMNSLIDRSLNYGRHLIEKYLQTLNVASVDVALDIGAGHGDDLLLVRKYHPSAKFHAFEIHPPYQDQLTKQNIDVHSVNIERDVFPFPNESVDVIIANQILEHVKEIFWIFHEASRVLKVGGSFIIGVPNLASLHNRILLAIGKQPTCIQNNSAHIRGYTKKDLLNLNQICFPDGYSLERFGGSNFYPFPAIIAKPFAAIFPNMAWGIFLLIKKHKQYNGEFINFPNIHQLETNFFLGNK
jgi:ubiquinone/menaquinone biosynthesis C-methylase UbiE